jgi:hypothetical protein
VRRLADIVCMGAFAVACAPPPSPVPDVPAAPPHDVTATLLGDQAAVAWQLDDPSVRLKLRRSPDGATFEGTGTLAGIDLPEIGVGYWFTLSALGADGWGKSSEPSNIVQRTTPAQPKVPVMLPPYNLVVFGEPRGVHVSWEATAADGYTVVTDPPDLRLFADRLTRDCDLIGLRNGVTYRVGVSATRGTEVSLVAWSDAVVPAAAPSAPSNVGAIAHSGSATVSWTAPADTGGSAVTGWDVAERSDAPVLVTAAAEALSAEVPALANGAPVSFVVRARNAAGPGAWSRPTGEVTPAVLSLAPQAVAVTAVARGSAQLSWSAPLDTGGLPVLSYLVECEPGGALEDVAGTSVTLSRLPSDVPVQFRVTAMTAAGAGAASELTAPLLLAQ